MKHKHCTKIPPNSVHFLRLRQCEKLSTSIVTKLIIFQFLRETQNLAQIPSMTASNIPNNPMAIGINMATQMASTAAEAGQSAIKLGEQAMQGMAQTAMSGTQLVRKFETIIF